jgi:protein-S-isoprenylcysteine O-methyltransferase Ste14
MNKLNPMGIGPIIGSVALPWLAASIFISLRTTHSFSYGVVDGQTLFIIGLVLVVTGAVFYLFTIPALLKGVRKTRLMTGGPFYLCCNPLYTSIILFVIPGISLMMDSWIVLTTSVIAYIFFKIFIHREYAEMDRIFGNEFRNYRSNTPEFFPFPFRKWHIAR